MSECRFHTNIINERNPRDHEPSYRHQIHRTGGGLSGPREFGKPDFSFDDGPRTTVTTGGQAPHRWHTELSMVRGERTLLDTRRIIDANHLAGRSRRLTISGGLARRFGFGVIFGVDRNGRRKIVCDQLGPDHPPVSRAKVAPRHFAFGSHLDGWAALNWNRARTRHPLIDRGWRHVERIGQRALAAKYVTSFLDCVHGVNRKAMLTARQAMPYTQANSIAL